MVQIGPLGLNSTTSVAAEARVNPALLVTAVVEFKAKLVQFVSAYGRLSVRYLKLANTVKHLPIYSTDLLFVSPDNAVL